MYKITKETRNGILEFLTEVGFRSEKSIKENSLKPLTFDKIAGSKKVNELRKDCRIASAKKSIMLNY